MRKENVSWESDGLKICGEIHLPEKAVRRHPALIICHGIPAKTKGPDNGGYPYLAEQFCRDGFLVLIFNFRGTGNSQGNFDLLGWARDLEAGLKDLRSRADVDQERLYAMGFSGGAAVSIYVAALHDEIRGLVSCASPADFNDLTTDQGTVDFLSYAREAGIIRDPEFPPSVAEWKKGFETVKPIHWIEKIAPRPLLLIHGTADDVVGIHHAHLLYEKANRRAELFLIEGVGHRLRLEERAMRKAREWLKKVACGDPL